MKNSHGKGLYVAKPDDDPDGDGKTNLQEYLDQTDPTKPEPEQKPGKPEKSIPAR